MGKRTFIIAEVGQAHDGSLGILHSYIDAVGKTGADAIKFQTHVAEAESSPYEPFRVRFTYADATRQDYWRRVEFTAEQWAGIKRHCEDVKIEFLSTPSCVAAVDLLEKVGVERFKIGSGDTENLLLLERVARTGREVILSSGLSTFEELDNAVKLVEAHRCPVVVMQCTSEYPAPAERLGLNLIGELKRRYKHPIGLSDHSGSIVPSLAAVALGATYVETHVVFDRRMFGPDSLASITIDELRQLTDGIRMIECSMSSDFDKTVTARSQHLRAIFGKSLSLGQALPAGTVLKFEHLESKKPAGFGIPANEYARVVGRCLARDIEQWSFLTDEDLI